MGELLEAYQRHASNGGRLTAFEHNHHIEALKDTAVLQVIYGGLPEPARAEGLRSADIQTELKFNSALGLFAAAYDIMHPGENVLITECGFLEDKLIKMGMTLIHQGRKEDPSDFLMPANLFYALAGEGFKEKGTYHGKPFEIRPILSDIRSRGPVIQMTRNKDKLERHYTDNYTVHSRLIAEPEKVKAQVEQFEEALKKWENAEMMKKVLRNSPGM